jgi:hypothetical protein
MMLQDYIENDVEFNMGATLIMNLVKALKGAEVIEAKPILQQIAKRAIDMINILDNKKI